MQDTNYALTWARYRKWARRRLVAIGGFVPLVWLATQLDGLVRLDGAGASCFFLHWSIFALATVAMTTILTCPRCSKPFFCSARGANAFARGCMHCGLPKWAIDSDGNVPAKQATQGGAGPR
jgi:hypothetical protein